MSITDLRSLLFIPGTNCDWLEKASHCGADGVIFDLEDAVDTPRKAEAASAVGHVIANRAGEFQLKLFVRVNAWGSGRLLPDLESVLNDGLQGVVLPKVKSESDVIGLDLLLGELEQKMDIEVGSTEIVPLMETASGVENCAAICSASPRVLRLAGAGGGPEGGDLQVEVGFQTTPEGIERAYAASKVVFGARSVGIGSILGTAGAEFRDLDRVHATARRCRAFGATGSVAIHPAQVPVVNEIYTVTEDELSRAGRVLETLADAQRIGHGAAEFEGRMIDLAHARGAKAVLSHRRETRNDLGSDSADRLDRQADSGEIGREDS